MTVPFAGALSKVEYNAMQKLGMGKLRYLGWYLLVIMAMTLMTGENRRIVISLTSEPLRLLPIAGLCVLVFALVPISIARAWKRNPRLRDPVSGEVSDEGVNWRGPFSQAEYPWSALSRWRDTAAIVLVYSSTNQAMYFPRSFFQSEGEWQAFRGVVQSHLRRG